MTNISVQGLPNRDDIRYQVGVYCFKEKECVEYQIAVKDLGLGINIRIVSRFSEIRKFHDQLVKVMKENRVYVPEFPQTNSFGFWNRTNADFKKIEQRRKDLQVYFWKLLNNPLVRSEKLVKKFLDSGAKEFRRSKSVENLTKSVENLTQASTICIKGKSLPKCKNGKKELIQF